MFANRRRLPLRIRQLSLPRTLALFLPPRSHLLLNNLALRLLPLPLPLPCLLLLLLRLPLHRWHPWATSSPATVVGAMATLTGTASHSMVASGASTAALLLPLPPSTLAPPHKRPLQLPSAQQPTTTSRRP